MSHVDNPQRGRRRAMPGPASQPVTAGKAADTQRSAVLAESSERPRDAARRARQASLKSSVTQSSVTMAAGSHAPLPFPLDLPAVASLDADSRDRASLPVKSPKPVSPKPGSGGEVLTQSSSASALPRRSALRQAERQRSVTKVGVQGHATGRVHLAQRGSIAMAATGLALAAIVPSTTAVNAPVVAAGGDALSAAAVSADGSASVAFDGAAGASTIDPDNKLKNVLKVSASQVSPVQSKGTLRGPLEKLQTNSPFGYRVNPLTGAAGELHTGQDFAAQCGTPVYAAAGGTVSFAAWHTGGGGNRVVIDHGNGLSTTYNHNTSLTVKQGQKVNRGDLIAMSGTTGNSTGCHVHFEVMVDNKTVDPMNWL